MGKGTGEDVINSWMLYALIAGWSLVGVQQYRIVSIKADHTKERNETLERAIAAEQAQRVEEQRRITLQAQLETAANEEKQQVVVDDRVSADAFERLRVRYQAATDRATSCGNSLTQSISQTAEQSARMHADMLERVGEAVRLYASIADQRAIAGRLCEASYDSLTK